MVWLNTELPKPFELQTFGGWGNAGGCQTCFHSPQLETPFPSSTLQHCLPLSKVSVLLDSVVTMCLSFSGPVTNDLSALVYV